MSSSKSSQPDFGAIAHVSPNQIAGLIEALDAAPYNGRADIVDVAYEQELEIDEIFPVADALQLLGLARIEGAEVELTESGKRFSAAELDERRAIFKTSLLKEVPLAAFMKGMISASRTIPLVYFQGMLERQMKAGEAEDTLGTMVSWARFAELFSFDDVTRHFMDADGQSRSLGDSIAISDERDRHLDWRSISPVKGVPSPFVFKLSPEQRVALSPTDGSKVQLPFHSSERDHAQRLEACRAFAADMIEGLQEGKYQVRNEYASSLRKYLKHLPTRVGDGNILLADMYARTLRSLFAAEMSYLSVSLAAQLKIFLEQHMGLRAFYPEIAAFYRDVREGHLSAPLPLDAVSAIAKGIEEFTPVVFEESVSQGLAEAVSEEVSGKFDTVDAAVPDPDQPTVPPDPLGHLDAHKSHDFATAGAVNSIWQAFQAGEKINKSIEGWAAAGRTLGPHVHSVIEWLKHFMPN